MRALDRIVLLVLGAGVLALVLGLRAAPSQSADQRIATADVLTLVEELLRTDSYAQPRIEREAELVQQMQGMQTELQMMSQQLQSFQPGDPQGQQLYSNLQAKQFEAQQFQQTSLEEFQRLGAEQAKEVYATVRAATARVAERENFSNVIATRSNAEMDGADTLTAVTQEILARPMAFGADRDDLTAQIRAELGMPDPSEQAAEDAAVDAQDAGEATDDAVEPVTDQPAP